MNEKMLKNKILIAEDMVINREVLRGMFDEQFEVLEASDGEEAIQYIKEQGDNIVIILLDLMMPKKTGLDVLKYMKEENLADKIPTVMITGEATVESDYNAFELGVSDIIYKPISTRVTIRRVLNLIELYENRASVAEELAESNRELKKSKKVLEKTNDFLINALSTVIEFRSSESGEHIQRVKAFTKVLLTHAMQMYPKYHLTEAQVEMISNASALHDIGKIAIPDNILLKPGKLTKEEFEVMKTHTTQGCQILESFKQLDGDFYRYCYDICRYHHERDDGRGYPDGIKGKEIPIWAQVVAIADVFDALVSKRVYKSPYAVTEAERMIMQGECGKFSPEILRCFQAAKFDMFELVDKNMSFADVDTCA